MITKHCERLGHTMRYRFHIVNGGNAGKKFAEFSHIYYSWWLTSMVASKVPTNQLQKHYSRRCWGRHHAKHSLAIHHRHSHSHEQELYFPCCHSKHFLVANCSLPCRTEIKSYKRKEKKARKILNADDSEWIE